MSYENAGNSKKGLDIGHGEKTLKSGHGQKQAEKK